MKHRKPTMTCTECGHARTHHYDYAMSGSNVLCRALAPQKQQCRCSKTQRDIEKGSANK